MVGLKNLKKYYMFSTRKHATSTSWKGCGATAKRSISPHISLKTDRNYNDGVCDRYIGQTLFFLLPILMRMADIAKCDYPADTPK